MDDLDALLARLEVYADSNGKRIFPVFQDLCAEAASSLRALIVSRDDWRSCEQECQKDLVAARAEAKQLRQERDECRKWHIGAQEVARLLTERAERAEQERDAALRGKDE